jgi:hypothetical protein
MAISIFMTVLCNASLIAACNTVNLNEKHKTLNLWRGKKQPFSLPRREMGMPVRLTRGGLQFWLVTLTGTKAPQPRAPMHNHVDSL